MKGLATIKGVFSVKSRNGSIIGTFGTDNETHTYLINGVISVPYSNKIVEKMAILNLPKSEKNKSKKEFNYTLKIDNTELHKASTIVAKSEIYINQNFFKKLNFYEKSFIIGHELGHKFYFNENFCDLFALHFLVENRIDPRFINFEKILSSPQRIHFIKNSFKIIK